MRRVNKDGKEFKRGDIREDGYIFWSYRNKKTKKGYCTEAWYHPSKYYMQYTSRARTERKNTGVTRARGAKRRAAQLKRRPKWIKDFFADQVKEMYTMAKELEKVFPWKMHVDHHFPMQGVLVSGLEVPWNLEILPWFENIKKGNKFDVNAQQPPSLPEGYYKNGRVYTQLGAIPTTGIGEDDNDADHHSGPIQGQDLDHSTEESSGNSVGCGNTEVVTLTTLTRIEDYGIPDAEIIRLEFGSGRLFS
jgi:hypothetical protein